MSLKMINGTQCSDCYGVFAEKSGMEIGIRPLLSMSSDYTYIGFRIRAVPNADADTPALSTQNMYEQTFPGFQFQKTDAVRASLVGGMFVNLGYHHGGMAAKEFIQQNRVVSKVMSALTEALQDTELQDEDLTREFLEHAYFQLIDSQSGHVDNPTKQADGDLVANNVVSLDGFKAKKEFDAIHNEPVITPEIEEQVEEGACPVGDQDEVEPEPGKKDSGAGLAFD